MPDCIGAVLDLLGYPAGSVANLAHGNLKLRFCSSLLLVSSLPGVLVRILMLIILWLLG